MRWLLFLLLIGFSFGVNAQDVLSPQELQEDFSAFKKQLYKRNKGLHLFVSEEEFAAHLQEIEKELQTEKTQVEFMALLQKAIIPVKERHLSVNGFHRKSDFAKKLKKKDSTGIHLFPLYVYFQNDTSAYIIRNAHRDSTVQLPSKLLTVNGEKVENLREEISQYITQDNGVTTWRNFELSHSFSLNYYYHIDTTSTFVVSWQDSLKNTRIDTLKGMTRKAFVDSLNKQSKAIYGVEKSKSGLRYKLYDSLNVGYLKIGSFKTNKQKFDKGAVKYKTIVKKFFEEVDKEKLDHVIIDLRNNTGGSVDLLTYLFSYIQPENKKMPLFTQLRNRNYWWGEVERERTTRARQRKPHFDGQVYVMTNRGSYSASVMFAVYAKKLTGAIIAGEAAGGRPTGTTAGSFHVERLKHSDILVRIPEHIFYYDTDGAISIEPDIPVLMEIGDYFDNDSDNQLDTLLDVIADEQ